jgi:hypothetical protein
MPVPVIMPTGRLSISLLASARRTPKESDSDGYDWLYYCYSFQSEREISTESTWHTFVCFTSWVEARARYRASSQARSPLHELAFLILYRSYWLMTEDLIRSLPSVRLIWSVLINSPPLIADRNQHVSQLRLALVGIPYRSIYLGWLNWEGDLQIHNINNQSNIMSIIRTDRSILTNNG